MITSGNLPFFSNSIYDVQLDIQSPVSGFEFSLMETGDMGGPFGTTNLITFSGKRGFIFDQSGNFAGYTSGVPLNIQIYYDYPNQTFSYYYEGVLMANGLDATGAAGSNSANMNTGKVNHIRFTKHGDSSLSLDASGTIS